MMMMMMIIVLCAMLMWLSHNILKLSKHIGWSQDTPKWHYRDKSSHSENAHYKFNSVDLVNPWFWMSSSTFLLLFLRCISNHFIIDKYCNLIFWAYSLGKFFFSDFQTTSLPSHRTRLWRNLIEKRKVNHRLLKLKGHFWDLNFILTQMLLLYYLEIFHK